MFASCGETRRSPRSGSVHGGQPIDVTIDSTSVRARRSLSSRSRAERSSSSSGRAEPSADTFKRNRSSPSPVSSAATSSGRKSKVDSRLGLRRVNGPARTGQQRLQIGLRRQPALVENRNAVLDRPGTRRRRVGRQRASIEPVEPGGSDALQPGEQFGGLERFGKLEVDDLAATLDSQPQGQGEGHLGPGVEALSQGDRDSCAAQHPLQAAHDVVMADQSEIAALGESESHFGGFCHIPRTRTPHCTSLAARYRFKLGWRAAFNSRSPFQARRSLAVTDRQANHRRPGIGMVRSGSPRLMSSLSMFWPRTIRSGGANLVHISSTSMVADRRHACARPSAPRTMTGERLFRSTRMIGCAVRAKPGAARL